MQTIDAFPHILPKQLFERMVGAAETRAAQTWLNGSRRHVGLYDLDVRFRVMDRFADYRQVLTLATPPRVARCAWRVGANASGPSTTECHPEQA